MKKRLTALMLAIMVSASIFLSTAVTASAASISYDNAIGFMNAIGVIAPGKITKENENSPVTRIDFVMFMSALLGLGEESASGRDYFYDIPEDHWAKMRLNAMVENNLIDVGEHYFRPNDAITKEEAAAIAVTALGGQTEANLIGGYPSGYLSVAQKKKLFKGISSMNQLTYKEAAVLLYNTAIGEVTYINKKNGMKFEDSAETILTLYHDIYFGEGEVSAVEGISIDNTAASENEIVIGGEQFKTEKWYYDYLGLNVKYFYEQAKDGNRTIVFLMNEDTNHQEVVEISSKYYEKYDENYIYYSEESNNSKVKKIRVYPGATVIRNGEKTNTDIITTLDKDNIYGTIRIVDTDKFDGADLIIIEDYENLVVSYIDEENKKVYGKDSSLKPLDLNEDRGVFVKYFGSDGTEKDFSEIVLDTLISAAVSKDGNCAIVRMSGKTVSGIVDGKGIDENGEPYFRIDGVTYNVQGDFYNKKEESIALGINVTFCIDAFGNIAASFGVKREDMQYACLINAYITDAIDTVQLEDERCVLRLYTASGEMICVPCATKVKVDNQSYIDQQAIVDCLSSLGEVQVQGILFKYDSKGNVENIDTTVKSISEHDNTLRKINTSDGSYYHWTGLFSNVAYMPSDIPLMLVPPKSYIKAADINDFAIKTRSALTVSKTYNIDFLTTDPDSRIPDIAICYQEVMTEASDNNEFYVVEKVTKALNADEEPSACLTLDNSGDSKYMVSTDYELKPFDRWNHVNPYSLSAGDIVRIGVNIIGEITDIKLVFDYSVAQNNTNESFFNQAINPSYGLNENSMVGANTDTVTGHGYVVKKYGTVFEWGFNSPHQVNQIYSSDIQPNTLKVMVFDDEKRKDRCTNGTVNDLVSYEESETNFSKIVTLQKDKILSKIIIYK